jgi:hypothetical protein
MQKYRLIFKFFLLISIVICANKKNEYAKNTKRAHFQKHDYANNYNRRFMQ